MGRRVSMTLPVTEFSFHRLSRAGLRPPPAVSAPPNQAPPRSGRPEPCQCRRALGKRVVPHLQADDVIRHKLRDWREGQIGDQCDAPHAGMVISDKADVVSEGAHARVARKCPRLDHDTGDLRMAREILIRSPSQRGHVLPVIGLSDRALSTSPSNCAFSIVPFLLLGLSIQWPPTPFQSGHEARPGPSQARGRHEAGRSGLCVLLAREHRPDQGE